MDISNNKKKRPCPVCHGTEHPGLDPKNLDELCPTCRGSGYVDIYEPLIGNIYPSSPLYNLQSSPPPRRPWTFVALGATCTIGILILALILSSLNVGFESPFASRIVASTVTATPTATHSPNATASPTVTVGPGTLTAPPPPTAIVGPGTPSPTTGAGNHNPTAPPVNITATPPPTFTTVDDAIQGTGENQFNYTGTWLHAGGLPFDFDGTLSKSVIDGDTASITFTGIQIQLYATRGPELGIVGYVLDGRSEVRVDQYASTHQFNQLLFDSGQLSRGHHTLEVLCTGSKNANSSNDEVTVDDVVIES